LKTQEEGKIMEPAQTTSYGSTGVSGQFAKPFGTSDREFIESFPTMEDLLPPFRLSETWHQGTVKRLQARLLENGLDGIILEDVWNIIYYSGLFHSKTERPFWLFVPAKGLPCVFHAALDRDLVDTWWIEDREWYFDYPHHGPVNSRVYEPGPRVDLLEWMLKNLAARGFSQAKLGVDTEIGLEKASRMQMALPDATFQAAGNICLGMRQIKTSEEIDLLQKAVDLQDHMLEFARAFILQYGTDVTDFDVRLETERYATHLLMQWLELDGKPHNGVGIDFWFGCRAGVTTAYPHPNQFFYHKIERGDAIQLAGFVHLGGYVGEGYRALQTKPATDLHGKMWRVHTEMTELQAQLCSAGSSCNEVASAVLKLARDAGLEEYVYHRPAHGIGMEGHQAPYLSLGDETILEEGMVLSNEPGLYNPEGGWGYNHSNAVLVGKGRGTVLNRTPLTEEWCWLEI
jgi:Xaa-Pro dipeptidase